MKITIRLAAVAILLSAPACALADGCSKADADSTAALLASGEAGVIHSQKDLPAAVMAELGRMADPGEGFNTMDFSMPGDMPSRGLKIAYRVRNQYVVAYDQGGIALFHETVTFNVVGGKAVSSDTWAPEMYCLTDPKVSFKLGEDGRYTVTGPWS